MLAAKLRELVTGSVGETGPPGLVPVPDAPLRLDRAERRQLQVIRRFGTVGSLLLACGGLGAGASPTINPLLDTPILGVFARIPTVAMASAFSGMLMMVLAWLWLGRLVWPGRPRMLSRAQMDRTLVMWTIPLILVPPMFSQDVYSYLAQSAVVQHGMDPYTVGAAQALGPDNLLARNVPTLWRETPSPYGPLFLTIGRAITGIAGDNIVLGILLERVLALVGLGLIVWALPRLARRFRVPPVSAIWLAAANPLVVFHLVIGVHNEALAIGLMLAGFHVAIANLPKVRPGDPIPPWQRHELVGILAGTTLITMGAGVKAPALVALGFVGVMIARRWGGGLSHLLKAGAVMLVIGVGVMTLITVASGLGWGWLNTLTGGTKIYTWLSPVTLVALGGVGLGVLFQVGNHVDNTIAVARAIGWVGFAGAGVALLWQAYRGRLSAMAGLGLFLFWFVVLGPVVQPWYPLWAIIPLATCKASKRFRLVVTVFSALIALVTPPTGSTFDGRAFLIPTAAAAALITVGLLLLTVRGKLPEREPRGELTVTPATSEPVPTGRLG
ncbi:polyprenol phosphomannose-dependent alpha 1,6 mannosyltransferase MptB [Kutzneria sp. NPDC052558]|uniref:polyprenol phosphomannose-dependent alpha 1,6 mannosyltransferase MptB n=1 Tax=Kutzneria sp. NPDC052558 TaxID=3364121 RepID=UPI0037C8313E